MDFKLIAKVSAVLILMFVNCSLFVMLGFGCNTPYVTQEPVNPYPDGYSLTHRFVYEGYAYREWCIYGVKYLMRDDFLIRLSDTNGNPIPCEVEKQ